MPGLLREFIAFGIQQARACVFAGLFFLALTLSKFIHIDGIARYDLILIAALVIQAALLLARIETLTEGAVLAAFHLLGLMLELFKTQPGIQSWSYPEPGIFKVGAVPLYSGFMYAAIASYMCQAWRIQKLRLTGYPPHAVSVTLSAAIYLNFFTHHTIGDFRWWLVAAVVLVFTRTRVHYTVLTTERRMPLVLSFMLIGFFVWIAENVATFNGAWLYPNQHAGWKAVAPGKISSWSLLVIVTFIIVTDLKHIREGSAAVSQARET